MRGSRLSPDLPTWAELNDRLRNMTSSKEAEVLLAGLRSGDASPRWLRRAKARLNKLRNREERAAFEAGLRAYRGPRQPKQEARP